MITARTSPAYHTSLEGHPVQATGHHHRASKLFEKDRAYAARLAQIATVIRSVVRSTVSMDLPETVPSETERGDSIATGIRRRTAAAHRASARLRGEARAGVGLTKGTTGDRR